MKSILYLIVVVSASLLLVGCAAKSRDYAAPSASEYEEANVAGYKKGIRYWGDETASFACLNLSKFKKNKNNHKQVDVLALSGGAENGAYGAGILNGWTQRGDRPEFTVVTGVSAGAIIAPFAFLGPKYDRVIKKLFAENSKENVFDPTPIRALFGGSAMGDASPLRNVLEEEIDDAFIAELAKEGEKGRMLQIGTTNLDAQRPVVWEITEIAKSGRPDAKKLILDIILASASIPGLFPPVLIDVTINGKRYQEVHVDGAVTRQIFVYSSDLDIRRIERTLHIHPKKNIWLIRNHKIDPDYSPVILSVNDISDRSFSTLIKYHGRSDLANITALAKRDGFHIHITNVPKSFHAPLKERFDKAYMQALYQVGYERGRSSATWYTTFRY
ncbi:MAG: patatin-like phospholipase family protein [Sulfurimonas sp.]